MFVALLMSVLISKIFCYFCGLALKFLNKPSSNIFLALYLETKVVILVCYQQFIIKTVQKNTGLNTNLLYIVMLYCIVLA